MKRISIAVFSLFGSLACGSPEGGDDDPTTDTNGTTDATPPADDDDDDDDAAATSAPDETTSTDPDSTSGDDDGTTGSPGSGCEGTTLLENPSDPSQPGPWPVGVRTVTIDGLTVEVWYPATPGSQAARDPVIYDIRDALPTSEQTKIADADNPWQTCDCFRDLPLDDAHGPYPPIVFVHGTASFRTQSLPQVVHWASRGFIVVAADHPGLRLADTLGAICGAGMVAQDLAGDLRSLLDAIRGTTPELAMFGDRIDATRIGMAGHSAGGNAIAGFSGDAKVLVPMAAGGTQPGVALLSTLVLGGTADSVVMYGQQQSGYASSPSPKRLVGIAEAGHLSFSEICSLRNAAGDDLLTIAVDNGVCGAQLAGFLFQCSRTLIADALAWEIIDYVTSAVFEETLQCRDATAHFDELTQRFSDVAEYEQG